MVRSDTLAVLAGGGVAGTLDITYAILVHGARGIPALTILQSVASGALGRAAYSGGITTGMIGLGLHFAMTIAMAGVFVAAFHMSSAMQSRPLLAGCAYGAALFVIMNYAVVPMSRAVPGTPPQGWLMAGAVAAHIFLVGLPIAFSAARWARI